MTTPPVRLFLSYSHKDEALVEELRSHLSGFRRRGLITEWYDRCLLPGTLWKETIPAELGQADLILLCLSADFVSSAYVQEVEVTGALERLAAGKTQVVPLFLRPCHLEGSPFQQLQGLPAKGGAVTEWENRDQAFQAIAKGIEELLGRRPRTATLWPSWPSRPAKRGWRRWGYAALALPAVGLAATVALPAYRLAQAEGAWLRGDWPQAQATAERALQWGLPGWRWGWSDARAHWLAGLAAERRGDPAAADHLRQAVALDPDDPRYRLSLAAHLEGEGKLAEAERLLEPTARSRPWLLDASLHLALVLRGQQGRVGDARYYQRQLREQLADEAVWRHEENQAEWGFDTDRGPIAFDTREAKLALLHAEEALTLYLDGAEAEAEAALAAARPAASGVDPRIFDGNVLGLLAWHLHRLEQRQPALRGRLAGFRQRFGVAEWGG